MRDQASFHAAYRELERRMKALADAEGDVFLPNPEPEGPVQYVLICMEPSIGRWASSSDEARSKVDAGFRNFLFSIEDFILHFCTQRYLCKPSERYHMTDLSKGAMLVDHANTSRHERYDRWYSLLQEELDLVATPEAGIVAVGKVVAQHLERRCFPRPSTRVIHYSGQAASARNAGIVGREDDFLAFKESVSFEDLVTVAKDVLRRSCVPARFRNETLSRLVRSELTISRKKLTFNYKIAFESIR